MMCGGALLLFFVFSFVCFCHVVFVVQTVSSSFCFLSFLSLYLFFCLKQIPRWRESASCQPPRQMPHRSQVHTQHSSTCFFSLMVSSFVPPPPFFRFFPFFQLSHHSDCNLVRLCSFVHVCPKNRSLVTEMLPVDHPGNHTPAKFFADTLARSLCRETRARAWCSETNGYAPIKQKRCPVSLPGELRLLGTMFFFLSMYGVPPRAKRSCRLIVLRRCWSLLGRGKRGA